MLRIHIQASTHILTRSQTYNGWFDPTIHVSFIVGQIPLDMSMYSDRAKYYYTHGS